MSLTKSIMKSGLKHKTMALPQEDFEVGRMKPLSYSLKDISNAIIHHVGDSPHPCTPIQRAASVRVRAEGNWNLGTLWKDNIQPRGSKILPELQRFFSIFNDLYFNGILTGYCTISIDSRDRVSRRSGVPRTAGVCLVTRPEDNRDPFHPFEKPHIEIIISYVYPAHDGLRLVKHYLETLLHEMLHAAFYIYACACENGCRETLTYAHHLEYQAAAREVEDFQLLWYWGLNLNREGAMAIELQRGMEPPDEATMDLLRLNKDNVLKCLKVDPEEKIALSKDIYLLPQKKNLCSRDIETVDAFEEKFHYRRVHWPRFFVYPPNYISIGGMLVEFTRSWD